MMSVEIDRTAEYWRGLYRNTSLLLSIVFCVVGIVFLVIPEQVLSFFNSLSRPLGLEPSPTTGARFYLVLAVAYMMLVSTVAFMMFREPDNGALPFLLIVGKSASAMISVVVLVVHDQFLIYVVNALTDGTIALGVFLLHRRFKGVAS